MLETPHVFVKIVEHALVLIVEASQRGRILAHAGCERAKHVGESDIGTALGKERRRLPAVGDNSKHRQAGARRPVGAELQRGNRRALQRHRFCKRSWSIDTSDPTKFFALGSPVSLVPGMMIGFRPVIMVIIPAPW